MKATAIILITLGAALSACGGSTTIVMRGKCKPNVAVETRTRHVDLTQPLQTGMPVPPGSTPFSVSGDAGPPQKFAMGTNVGTYLAAPAQAAADKRNVAQIRVEDLQLPAINIDMRARVKDDPDYRVNAGDLSDWEAAYGEIPIASLVIINTGWHLRFRDPVQYLNQDAEGVLHHPGLSKDAVQLLIERDVAGVGIDTASLDHGPAANPDAQQLLLGADKYILHNLAQLDALPPTGAVVSIGLLPLANANQAPARVVAEVPVPPATAEE